MRKRFLGPALFLLLSAGCSIKNVRVESVSLCQGAACEPASASLSREALLARIYELFKGAKGTDIELYRSDAKTRGKGGRGLRYYVQGGPMPAVTNMSAFKITDVLYMDRGRSEIKLKLRPKASYLFLPVVCAEGEAVVTVSSPDDIAMRAANVCTWLIVGTSRWAFDFKLDSFDFGARAFTGHVAVRGGGPLCFGGGTGYVRAELGSAPAPEAPAREAKAPVRPPEPQEEVLSQLPQLSLRTKLQDEDGDLVLEGGEQVALSLMVDNPSGSAVPEAELRLSGSPALVEALGARKPLGALSAGGSRAVELKGRLPKDVPAETTRLRIDLMAGGASAAAKVLLVAMRPKAAAPEEELLSETGVDEIPARGKSPERPDDAALVVGIGDYREKFIPAVKYAARDAEIVARYLENVAGVPASNIKLLTDRDATRSDLEAYLEDWLTRRTKPDSTVYFYFAGHGTPDPGGKEAFLVPYEGHPDFPAKLFPLRRLYDSLGRLPAKRAIVMLDSCFSGAQGRGILPQGARPLVMAAAPAPQAKGKLVVMAAATGSQISSDFDKVEHGLFTYYLLKGLRGEADADKDGKVSLGELFRYVRSNVSKTASLRFNRDQTPVLMPEAGEAAAQDAPLVERAR